MTRERRFTHSCGNLVPSSVREFSRQQPAQQVVLSGEKNLNRSMLMFQRTSWLSGVVAATALAFTLLPASPAEAKGHGVGGAWTAQGPAPVVDDLVNVPPDNGVVGAVHALVPHP